MEMISDSTYRRIFKAIAMIKSRLAAQKLSDERLVQIAARLEFLYNQNQKLREALKQNMEDYSRHYDLLKKECHSIEKQLQKRPVDRANEATTPMLPISDADSIKISKV